MANFINENCHGCDLCVRYCPVEAIHGEHKQRHWIEAALCIECNACGRVCGFAAVQDARGDTVQRLTRELWPTAQFDYTLCQDCNACQEACPTGAIALRRVPYAAKRGSHRRPVLLRSKLCLGCALCASACPSGAISILAPQLAAIDARPEN